MEFNNARKMIIRDENNNSIVIESKIEEDEM
jgi:hypothetical protein